MFSPFRRGRYRVLRPSRRAFLRGMAGAALWSPLSRLAFAASTPLPAFEEIPPSVSGIRWIHTAGMSDDKYLPETTGAGCAFLDYDNDGWMDIYLVNGGRADFFTPATPLRNALYRNNRDGTFTDVTDRAGVGSGGYGMGVAVGDYDGDGFPDMYVTQYDRSILYHNNGDGTFTDVTEKAAVAAPGWATSAVWFDYDNDGRLDLFVCRYVDFTKARNVYCGSGPKGDHHYCDPRIYLHTLTNCLFHNNGDGTFTDVSKASGIAKYPGKFLGVVATDINNDGLMDLFVADDTVADLLFVNRGGGKFEEIGFQADLAYSADGRTRSSMGTDSADFDQDGWMDLFVANINEEIFSLYRNKGDETFEDIAMPMGIGMATRSMSGWGAKIFDYDNDGSIDLLVANGAPDDKIEEIYSQLTYREPLLLFQNSGGVFKNVSAESGPVFRKSFPARGMAIGDFNNDGAIDVLVSTSNGAPVLLRNNKGRENHWLGLKLVGRKANIDAVGARISYQAGDLKASRMKVGGGSYLSSHDPRVVLGLGKRTKIDWLEIRWPQPSGVVSRFTNLPLNRYITIVEGATTFSEGK